MNHQTDDLIRAARQRAVANPGMTAATRRYQGLAQAFRSKVRLEKLGIRRALEEIESDTGVVPPSPATIRGRFGRKLIDLEIRTLWWVVCSFRLRDRAMQLMYAAMLDQEPRLDVLEQTLADALSTGSVRRPNPENDRPYRGPGD